MQSPFRLRSALRLAVFLTLLAPGARAAETRVLKNDLVAAEFGPRGLLSVIDLATSRTIRFANEGATVTVDDARIDTGGAEPKSVEQKPGSIAYLYANDGTELRVTYEIQPGWRFVSKQIGIARPGREAFTVKELEMFRARVDTPVAYHHVIDREWKGVWAAFLRFTGRGPGDPGCGMFFTVQNPFMKWTCYYSNLLSLSYKPELEWKASYGPFSTDRAFLGIYSLSGTEYPARRLSENLFFTNTAQTDQWAAKVDIQEILALEDCVRAFLMVRPRKSVRIQVGWCGNDYQIDIAKPEGRAQYKRLIDRAAQMGIDHILFGAANSDVSSLEENRDAWGWENVLWLGLGQKIRKDQWDPNKDPIPASLQEILDYAKSKRVKLVAYVYPTVGFMQDPQWTAWAKGNIGGYNGVDSGERGFQDWFIKKLVDFHKRTGIGGYSFDLWYMNGGTSPYAQWYGMRRVLEELRRQIPDVVLDGRQTHQSFGAWTCLSGIYPHPFGYDEQPGSFGPVPDLHTDRLSANHTRSMNWMYRMQAFCPVEVTPGFITHQTQRGDAQGKMPREDFRLRDWDQLGWRYSLISSIATAPFNQVVNLIPARDEAEFKAFSPADQAWFRQWLDWTDRNLECLRHLRPIIGMPLLGRVDGTAAFQGGHGFVFLFNPNYRAMPAEFRLDASIGLDAGERYRITQLYPADGLHLAGADGGFWKRGDRVSLPLPGAGACVLEVSPAEAVTQPVLFNARGKAELRGATLAVTEARGETGTSTTLRIAVPAGRPVENLTVNGKPLPLQREGDLVSAPLRFAGTPFGPCQPVGYCPPGFAGTLFAADFTVPARIAAQLEARKKAWPVPYTQDDLLATWLGPWRLLLFVYIAGANPQMEVSLRMDGQPLPLQKAFNGIYGGDSTFLGFYADLSAVVPETPHRLELRLPAGLEPGQFQGLYFDNIEPEYTTDLQGE